MLVGTRPAGPLAMLFIDYVFTAIWFYVRVRRRAMSSTKVQAFRGTDSRKRWPCEPQ